MEQPKNIEEVALSDRANIAISTSPKGRCQVIGNVVKNFFILKRRVSTDGRGCHSQFQESKRRIFIEELLLALLNHVFLKDGGCLWVVAVEAVEDFFDVLWALFAPVESLAHGSDHYKKYFR
jgi:hypothetical protein